MSQHNMYTHAYIVRQGRAGQCIAENIPAVEQTYTIPNSSTTTPLNTSAYTGTLSEGCTRPNHRDPNNALSRANDQVMREAVWCTAFRATKPTVKSAAMNTVLAMGEAVAWVQIW